MGFHNFNSLYSLHCVFTIDSQLRHFFLENRSLLGCLFKAVSNVIFHMFHKDNKTEKFTPGFICVLHTFGRDLKYNPHIHCLISEGGIAGQCSFLNFTIIINVFLWKNCTRKQCPLLVERDLLHDFSILI